jgi:hypothetical protein
MKESLIAAERECTEQVDIKPDKLLRPIGYVFKEWADCLTTTDLPHWILWEIVGYMEVYRGRRGNKLLFERCEEVLVHGY